MAFQDKLSSEDRAQLLSLLEKGKLVAKMALQAAADAADTASRSLAPGIIMGSIRDCKPLSSRRDVVHGSQHEVHIFSYRHSPLPQEVPTVYGGLGAFPILSPPLWASDGTQSDY